MTGYQADLFGGPDTPVNPQPARAPRTAAERRAAGLPSPDQARTARQHAQAAAGIHPLTRGRVHPDAPGDPLDKHAEGLRCGSCAHLFRNHRGYLKCGFGDGVRAARSADADVRTWWPACPDHQPEKGQQ
jgi:hypothetical protein